MARFDPISDDTRQAIVAKAAPLLGRHDEGGLGAANQPVALGPSLREEVLPFDAIKSGTAPKPTGQTLSLIQIPSEHTTLGSGTGTTKSFGHVIASEGLGGAAPESVSVSASDLSTRIQEALDWIDKSVGGDPVTRVMSVPTYLITALSLYVGGNLIGVVALPSPGDTRFQPKQLYKFDQFVALLRDLPTASGLAPPPPV